MSIFANVNLKSRFKKYTICDWPVTKVKIVGKSCRDFMVRANFRENIREKNIKKMDIYI